LHVRAHDYENGLNLVKALLDRDANDASAWMRSGEIHRAKAEIPLDAARELIDSRLVADEALRAEEELEHLAAMDPGDPRRPAAGHALAARFDVGDEDRATRILRLADAAARENAQARTGFATSLAVRDPRADPGRALASLVELLARAGRQADAAEVGICGLKMMQSRGDTASIGVLVDVLQGLDRQAYACEVGSKLVAMTSPVSPDRLLKLTRLFYANERWPDLAAATGRLMQVGNTAEANEALYYSALAQVHVGQFSTGLYSLQRFLATPEAEGSTLPEGARAEAWRMMALAARRLRMADLEREALDTAIQLDRDGSGEEMLRLAAILAVTAHGGYRRSEVQVAQAMDRMPERTAELFPVWERYGRGELEEAGLSATDVLSNEGWNRVLAGASDSSVYELHTLARVLLFRGQAARAEAYVRQMNGIVPRFVPGIDLWIRTMQKLRRDKDLADALLVRMRLAGADAGTRAILASLSPRSLDADRRIAFMQADPEGFGRREVARGFLQSGRPDVALQLLGSDEPPNDLPEAREIAAAAHLDRGEAQEAFKILDALGPASRAAGAGLELYARTALASGHRKSLEIAMTRASRTIVPRRGPWLRLADRLLSHGAGAAALPLVRRLDSDARTRGGDVLLRLAWIQLLAGDRKALSQTLERADAFETDGAVDLVGLLASLEGSGRSKLPEAIAHLKRSGWKPTRLQRAALHVLDEDDRDARALVEAGLADRPEDPAWILLDRSTKPADAASAPLPGSFGPDAEAETARFLSGEGKIDRRLLAGILLVLDDPIAGGWIEAKVRARLAPGAQEDESGESGDSEAGGTLWDHWLMARLARVRGDVGTERLRLEHLLALRPAFVPAWDRLEEIAAASRIPGEGVLEVRERRLHALGVRAGTDAQRDLDVARLQRRDGDLDGALASIESAAQRDPHLPGLELERGLALAARGEWKEAVHALAAASDAEPSGPDRPATAPLIEALARAGQAVPPALSVQERAGELEALAKRAPDDARVPVALARMDLERDPRNPGVSVARGVARLVKFQAAHKDGSLEQLGAGASAAWTDFLIELDPERARRILQRDRQRDPAVLEPWIQIGRIRAAQAATRRAAGPDARDEEAETTDELEIVRRMAPVRDVLAAHARVRLAGSPRLQEILRIAREVPASEGREEPDADLAVRLARAHFATGSKGTTAALAILNKLAWTPDLPPELAAEAELLRAEVLVVRGDTNRAARILSEVAPRILDPYRATVALAAASLANRMAPQ
jgi:tetratricopeptide (TPR) repeat protein